MSKPFGSLAWIADRCQEDGDCLIWRNAVSKSGAPVATNLIPTGKKPTFQVRRLIWEAVSGPIPAGLVVAVCCRNPRCLRHLELITKAEVNRRQWARADLRARLTAGVTKAVRARSKIDMEAARSIRYGTQTLEAAAAEHGVSISLASLIRRGERWKETTASPWAGLGG